MKPFESPNLSFNKKADKYDIKTRESIKKATAKSVSKDIKCTDKTIKTANNSVNKAVKSTSETARKSYVSSKQSAKAAKNSAETAKKGIEKSAKDNEKKPPSTQKKIIKGIIQGAKALVNAIIAGGWVSVIIIIVLCLVGALASSFYGIFFSTGNIRKRYEYFNCYSGNQFRL